MKRITLLVLLICTIISLKAQDKFEMGIAVKMGYYFPIESDEIASSSPENSFLPGIGGYLNYNLFSKTKLEVGAEYNYLKTTAVLNSTSQLDVIWHLLKTPLNVKQQIGEHFYISSGIAAVYQLSNVHADQKNPILQWQAGAGWKFNKLKISVQFSQEFKENIKFSLENKLEDRYLVHKFKHREVFVKLEYPLWRF